MSSEEQNQLPIGLNAQQEVESMIHSRQWWIFVGNDPVYEAIERRFYPDAYNDHSFVTIMGPPPGEFRKVFPDARLLVLHFGRKEKLSAKQLDDFFASYPESSGGVPPIRDKQHIVFVDRSDQ